MMWLTAATFPNNSEEQKVSSSLNADTQPSQPQEKNYESQNHCLLASGSL